MEEFDEYQFQQQVSTAVTNCRKILENTRNPQQPSDVSHTYADKYHFAEFLTNTSLAAQLNILENLGVTPEIVKKLKEWSKTRSVTLQFSAEERCNFDREVTREVESPTKHVTEISAFGKGVKITDKVVTTITEYFWTFTASYQISVYQGTSVADKIVLRSRQGTFELKTSSKSTPKPQVSYPANFDVNITWLFSNLNDNLLLSFKIDREDKRCHTPRRNQQIEHAFAYFNGFHTWSNQVSNYFLNTLFPVQVNHGLDISQTNESIFVPIIPLFEEIKNRLAVEGEEASVIFSVADVNNFLAEQKRSTNEKFSSLDQIFPAEKYLITPAEAKIVSINKYNKRVIDQYRNSINYIESLLYKQLVAAIGKEVTPVDFTNYMIFHNRKLFKAAYEPRKFCYAIRRPDHYPEGILSIESNLHDGSISDPLSTIVKYDVATKPMNFSINAACNISFYGERYLHAWVGHEFSGQSGSSLNLVARARQFSSFIVLVGRIISANKFEPKYAIIIQNKDDLKIPLDLEQIPTAQQFRDAIESLSPEQQAFAKAFRSMQLESTLFGVCIIQIKPQLEKLLNIPADSLTKEIQLTQDLLELFIKYQIPSDLISYAGDVNASVKDKVNTVKGHVTAMQEMIKKSKDREIEEQKNIRAYQGIAERQTLYSAPPPPQPQVFYSAMPMQMSMMPTQSFSRSSMAPSISMMAPPPPSPSYSAPPPPPAASSPAPPPPPAGGPAPPPPPAGGSPAPAAPNQELASQDNKTPEAGFEGDTVEDDSIIDYTKIPKQLDSTFEKLDDDNAMHPTIINVGSTWTKKYQKALLAEPASETLSKDKQESERNRAFDLLDALSRSGVLPIDEASLHVVIASTHTFDKTLMKTVIQENVNPIEKVERSTLIVASAIHGVPAAELIKPEHLDRVKESSPKLF